MIKLPGKGRSGITILVALFVVILLFSGSTEASMIEMSLEELSYEADSIVVGTVESVTGFWNDDRTFIYSSVVLLVKSDMKGDLDQSRVTVIVSGGEVDGISQLVSNTPIFTSGEEAIVFLSALAPRLVPLYRGQFNAYEVVGNEQGKLELKEAGSVHPTTGSADIELEDLYTQEQSQPALAARDEAAGANSDFVYTGLRWPGSSPAVPYRINASADRIEQVRAAGATWSNAGANFRFEYTGTHSRNGRAALNRVNEIMWYDLGTSNVLGLATIWFDGGRIIETDMVFNTRFRWSTQTSAAYGYYDVQTVALHEFGHWLCLDHSPVYEAIMYYLIKGTQRYLHEADIAGIRHIYGTAESPPANDNFANRNAISGTSGQVGGSNRNATLEPGEPNHTASPAGCSVWWEWVAPADGRLSIDTLGSSFDTLLAVYTGSNLSDLKLEAENVNSGSSKQSKVEFDVTAGTSYKVAVAGNSGASGSITLNWGLAGKACSVKAPSKPEGPGSGKTGTSYSYTSGGSSCSNGHPLQYRFSWGEGTYSSWSSQPGASKTWSSPGTYNVAAQARCSKNISITSPLSPVHAVIIEREGVNYNLTIGSTGQGTTTPAKGTHSYAEGSAVTLVADPAQGWQFNRWVINGSDNQNASVTLTMNSNITANAVFTEEPAPEPDPGTGNPETEIPEQEDPVTEEPPLDPGYSLALRVEGEGTTNPAAGTHRYMQGENASLSAISTEGWRFVKWVVNGAEQLSRELNILIDEDKDVLAVFSRILAGDVTGDGEVTVRDVTMVVRYSLNLAELSDEQLEAADVNGDGKVNVNDVSLMMRYALELIDSFPSH